MNSKIENLSRSQNNCYKNFITIYILIKRNSTFVNNLNKHLFELEDDYLYHISLAKNFNNLKNFIPIFGLKKILFFYPYKKETFFLTRNNDKNPC